MLDRVINSLVGKPESYPVNPDLYGFVIHKREKYARHSDTPMETSSLCYKTYKSVEEAVEEAKEEFGENYSSIYTTIKITVVKLTPVSVVEPQVRSLV